MVKSVTTWAQWVVDTQLTLKFLSHVMMDTPGMDVIEQLVELLDNGVTALQPVPKVANINTICFYL